jgi:tetratricopeptide (TPR) repeat protein
VNQAASSTPSNRTGLTTRVWLLVGLGLVTVIGILCLLVLVPAGVRALPGRYAVRLPGLLQDLRHRPHSETLPTPAIAVTPFATCAPTLAPRWLRGAMITTAVPARGNGTAEQGAVSSPMGLAPMESTASPTPSLMTAVAPTVTATPFFSATAISSPTPSPTPRPPTPTAVQLPERASLPPITHTYQTWNNCGPATLSMALQYFDQSKTQADTATFLKPDPEDKNVNAHEMKAYVRSLGLEGMVRVGGDLIRLKRLIAAGFPAVVETWFIPEPGDQMGHYRLLVGYDDAERQFTAQDSYNGPNVRLDYDAFDELWRVFNRVYLVIYRPPQADELFSILGEDVDDRTMYEQALEMAQAEAWNPSAECVAYENCVDGSAFAWFNVGSSLTNLGRHQEAAAAYDQARVLGLPWRMLWYQFGPYESYYAVDRFDDVITLATATLHTTNNLEESYYWRGMAYLAQGDAGRARSDFEAALRYNPNFAVAKEALESLP